MNLPRRYQDYLDFIKKYPKYLGNIGNYRDGEIEVVSDVTLFSKCEEGAAKIMMTAGVPKEDAKKRGLIGVYDENRWGISIHEPLRLPNGNYTTFNRWISWGALESGFAGVVIVPLTSDGRYIFLKNYRNATKNWCIEFPRGNKDPGNSLLTTLKNELSEEMGATIIEDPRKVGEVFPDSGVLASRVEIFTVKVKITGMAEHEVTEAIRGLIFMPKDRVREMLKTQCYTDEDGKMYEFKDGFSLSALSLLM
jgi:8-oxo-dGTP pyrophosphatase MutT (NUDIX family)